MHQALCTPQDALKAYATSAAARNPREREADVFRQANAMLRHGEKAGGAARVRALADNARLWTAVINLLQDPENALPVPLRAAIVSVGLAVQRESRREAPDFAFLLAVNENVAAGLASA
ncbi:MAG: flagellar biosynthesis regulator FlaF [Alphaproteobacteria bacterium]|nr:flagellar biosynthesis regulator FlaF [Alphaproteobacteria bacterium]